MDPGLQLNMNDHASLQLDLMYLEAVSLNIRHGMVLYLDLTNLNMVGYLFVVCGVQSCTLSLHVYVSSVVSLRG